MEEAGAIGPTHLNLSQRPELTIEDLESIAVFLGRLHDGSKWWTADLLLEAEVRFGEDAHQIVAATGRSERTVLNWVWVASRVARSRRREELSFTHHSVVAPLDPQAQREWLQQAVDRRMSSRDLRDAISLPRGSEQEKATDGCDGFDEGLMQLRALARRCYGEVAVEVFVRAPGVEYRFEVEGEQ
jgi:hypothetical protein